MNYPLPLIEKQLLLITRQFLLEQETERAMCVVSMETSLERQLSIDSLGKVELIHRIEKAFAVQLSESIVAEADTLGAIAHAILTTSSTEPAPQQTFALALEHVDIDLSKIATLHQALIQYAIDEPNRPHLYLPDEMGNEIMMTYGQLLTKACNIAHGLLAYGIRPDNTVAIMLPTHSDFFESFMGILLAGAIPVPIYPPLRLDRIEEYVTRAAKILNNAEARILITFAQANLLSPVLKSNVPSLKAIVTSADLNTKKSGLPDVVRTTDHPALIQYTSGSTGDPKGVLLLHKNILANIRAIIAATQAQPTDRVVSWLPLYHDMGLMSWITSLYFGTPVTILSPLTFLYRPERWLWAIHYHRATFSASPNFAYELCLKRIDEEALEGLDLSSWRLAFNGAETINPRTFERFYEKFKHYGLKEKTLFPVYGLAENTVALTFPSLHRPLRVDHIARDAFEKEGRAYPTTEKNALMFVSEGKAIPQHEIRIVDDEDLVLGERSVGSIQFRGPSAMQGYYRNPLATEQIYHQGWWDTGDLGYMADGDLFVTGRKKDLIIKAGRNFYPEAIEEVVGNIVGIRKGCVIAFGLMDAEIGTEKIVVVAETKLSDPTAIRNLKPTIIEEVTITLGVPPDQIIIVPPKTIAKTPSGKLQRSACKQAYVNGELVGARKSTRWQIKKLLLRSLGQRFIQVSKWLLRVCYTGYAGLVLGLTLMPTWLLCLLLPKNQAAVILKIWAQALFRMIFCPIRIINEKNIYFNQSTIYCANHASYVDSLVLLAILPPGTLFIGKKELLKAPIISSLMKKLKFITVDRWDFVKSLEDVQYIQQMLAAQHAILIFPEGTFTYASGLRSFKTGAFQLSVDTQTPICPIAIQNTRKLLRDGSSLLRPQSIIITVCEPIVPQGNDWQEIVRLRSKTRQIIAQHCNEPVMIGFEVEV